MWRFRQTPGIYSDRKNSERQGSGCGGGRFCRTGFALEWRGRGLSGGSRILRQQKGQEPNQEGRRALSSPSRAGGRADGAPFAAGWEARKFPPDVPPLRVKWEAGSCQEGRGRQRRKGEGLGLEGSRWARVSTQGS